MTTEFQAVIAKVQTLADGGIRLTLDLGEDATLTAAELMEYKRWGMVVSVTVTPDKQVDTGEQTGDVATGRKRKSEWQAAQE